MKTYKVLTSNAIFRIGGTEYIVKSGDVIELPEDHITTQALIERNRIEEVEPEIAPEVTETVPEKKTVKTTKK